VLEHHATREQNLSGSVSGSNPSPEERAPLEVGRHDTAGFTPIAVLTKGELADYLRLSERTLDRLDLPVVYLGERSPRYLLGSVLDEMKRREVLP